MPLSDIATVTISASAPAVTEAGFGTPLIAGYHTHHLNKRVLPYASTTEMTSDGWGVNEPVYLAAVKAFSQNPAPQTVKVGRCALPPQQSLTLTMLSNTEGDIVTFTLTDSAGVSTDISYTILSSATTTTVAAAVELLTEAATGVNSSSTGAIITLTPSTSNALIRVRNWSSNVSFADATPDPGIATDLAAIQAEDDDWYGLTLVCQSKAIVTAAAAAIEATEKVFAYSTSDYAVPAGTSGNVMLTLQTSAYARTHGQFDGNDTFAFSGAAILGRCLPLTPGSETWAYKTLAGVPATKLTSGQYAAVHTAKGNTYITTAGVNFTEEGISPAGEFLDVVRFRDWLKNHIQSSIVQYLLDNVKVAFNDKGIAAIETVVLAALRDGEKAGGLDEGSSTVTVPLKSAVSATNRALRKLTGVKFSGILSGAIHHIVITGSITT